MSQSTQTRCTTHPKRQHQPRNPRRKSQRPRKLRRKSQRPRNKQPNWLSNRRNEQAFILCLPVTEIIRAARFGGPFWCPYSAGRVFLKVALIGRVGLCGLARLRFLRWVGVLAGFFENRGNPARFVDLLLEPFLPMPI